MATMRAACPSLASGPASGHAAARRSRRSAAATAAAAAKSYTVTLLPGDGIGPEIMRVAVDCLKVVVRARTARAHLRRRS